MSRFSVHSRWFILALSAISILFAACSSTSSDDDDAETPATTPGITSTTAASTATSAPTRTPTPEPLVLTEHDLDLDLPRSFVYGGQVTTIRGAVVSNAKPGLVLESEPEPGEDWYVYLDAVVEYEAGYSGRANSFAFARYTLILGDGTELDATMIDFASNFTLREGLTAEILLGYPVDEEEDLDGAVLMLADVGYRPGYLPLTTPIRADEYPIDLNTQHVVIAVIEGGCPGARATITVKSAEIDIDAGGDHDDDAIAGAQNPRARLGEAFLRVHVSVLDQEGSCGPIIASDDLFRLSIDGFPTAPLNADSELLNPGTGADFTWGYAFEEGAELELLIGSVGGAVANIPLVVPDLPPDE